MAEVQEAEASTSAGAVLFKKRNKASSSSARRLASDSPAPVAGEQAIDTLANGQESLQPQADEDDREGTPSNLQELIELRKLRQASRKEGIDLERLNAGNRDKKRKKKKQDQPEDAGYGLQRPGGGGNNDDDSGNEDDNKGDAISRKIMKTDNFTHQTGIVDVDKHMMAYIERELKKRRGQGAGADFDAEKELRALDPRDELFKVAEKYRIESKVDDEEGNVATSSAMLTTIPEVDLGIDSRLKNIEATEAAKRRLMEAREKRLAGQGAHDDYHDSNYAGMRYFRHTKGNQTDFDALRAAKVEAGIEDDSEEEEYDKDMEKHFDAEAKKKRQAQAAAQRQPKEYATDDLVAERWKRSSANQSRGRGRGRGGGGKK